MNKLRCVKMKKSILGILISTTCGISIADYRMSVPMEVANGGALQNGSITFTGGTSPVVEPPAAIDECIPPVAGFSGWRVHKTNGIISTLWNGKTVSTNNPSATTSVLVNGINYTPDTSTTLSTPMYNFYGVCRNIPSGYNGGTWLSIAPSVSAWTDTGLEYACTWSPDASNFLTSQSVIQTGDLCSQDQQQTTQAREQNDSTFVIRDVGLPVISTQTIVSIERPTRTVTGTEVATEPETCINVAYSSTVWSVDKSNNDNVYNISWNGGVLSSNQNLGDVTTFNYNGVIYKRGEFLNDLTSGTYNENVYAKSYGVCRVNY